MGVYFDKMSTNQTVNFPISPDSNSKGDENVKEEAMENNSSMEVDAVEEGKRKIFVRNLLGEKFTLFLGPTKTIGNAKEKMKDLIGIPVEYQRLIYAGFQLENSRTLDNYHIDNEETLYLVERLRPAS
jgi:hypothetical protein